MAFWWAISGLNKAAMESFRFSASLLPPKKWPDWCEQERMVMTKQTSRSPKDFDNFIGCERANFLLCNKYTYSEKKNNSQQTLKYLAIILIKLYQCMLSPFLPNSCRFQPTCSEYALQAFRKYPVFKAFKLSFKRISRCHPWGGFGEDPLP